MKYIKRGKPPQALKDWVRANKEVPGVQYGTHGFPTSDTKEALLKEQGNLCAYAMVPLSDSTCHIEHIKPQALSRAESVPEETWDYNNLLACYPGNDPQAVGRNQFGATKKGNDWNGRDFVSPLQASCESRFRFSANGSVAAKKRTDAAAAWTIRTLGLDCEVLDEWRRAAIDAFGVSLAAPKPLRRSEAQQLRTALRKRRADGSFHGYCVAVEHAAEEYIALLDKRVKKKQHAARSRTAKGR